MEDCPHGQSFTKTWLTVFGALVTGLSWYGIYEQVDLGRVGTMIMINAAWIGPLGLIALFRKED